MKQSDPSVEKVLLFTTIDAAALNAPAFHILTLAREFAKAGLEVHLVVPRPRGKLVLDLSGQKRLTIEFTPRVPWLPNSLNVFGQLWSLWCHRHSRCLYLRSAPLSLVICAAARWMRFERVITEYNGWYEDELVSLGYPRIIIWAASRAQVIEAGMADGVRVVTEGLKNILLEYAIPEKRIWTIGNGTDISTYRPLNRDQCRKKLGLSNDNYYLVYSGNLAPWQDLPLAFKAVALLRAQGIEIELLVAGDGVCADQFKQQAKQICGGLGVRFLGARQPEEVNEIVNAANIAIAPFTENRNGRIGVSPLKICDYAAAGTMVISSDLPSLRDLAQQDWLTLTPCGDAEQFAGNIKTLLSIAAAELSEKQQSARQYAEQYFDWTAISKKVIDLIND